MLAERHAALRTPRGLRSRGLQAELGINLVKVSRARLGGALGRHRPLDLRKLQHFLGHADLPLIRQAMYYEGDSADKYLFHY